MVAYTAASAGAGCQPDQITISQTVRVPSFPNAPKDILVGDNAMPHSDQANVFLTAEPDTTTAEKTVAKATHLLSAYWFQADANTAYAIITQWRQAMTPASPRKSGNREIITRDGQDARSIFNLWNSFYRQAWKNGCLTPDLIASLLNYANAHYQPSH